MTELELMANEEARHGNREALERLEAELRGAYLSEMVALGQAQEAYEAQKKAEAERDAAYKRGLEDAAEIAGSMSFPMQDTANAAVGFPSAGAQVAAAIRAKIQETNT